MSTVLITGASGFIGSFLVEAALAAGHDVTAGIRESSNRQYLTDPRIRFLTIDLSSPRITERYDIIIHNAGITRARQKEDFDTVNHVYTRNLVEALMTSGNIPGKFVYMSSLATYGPGVSPKSGEPSNPIHLDDPQIPISAYAKSKLAAEQYLVAQKKLHTLIIRPTAVYGPRDRDFLGYFKMIAKGIDIMPGTQKQLLSFIYVKELSQAVIKLSACEEAAGAYILSDGNTYDKDQLGRLIAKTLDISPWRLRLPAWPIQLIVGLIEQLTNRLSFVYKEKLDELTAPNWSCDSSLAWSQINETSVDDLGRGVKETIEWYQEEGWL